MGISKAKKQIVIDNYFKNTCDVNTSIKEAFTKGFEIGLKKAPAPEPRWIPVSERFPEKSGEYLLCGKIGGHEEYNYCFIGEYTPYETFGFTHEYYDPETFSPVDSEIIEFHSVIAWMPLPEPYKAESER